MPESTRGFIESLRQAGIELEVRSVYDGHMYLHLPHGLELRWTPSAEYWYDRDIILNCVRRPEYSHCPHDEVIPQDMSDDTIIREIQAYLLKCQEYQKRCAEQREIMEKRAEAEKAFRTRVNKFLEDHLADTGNCIILGYEVSTDTAEEIFALLVNNSRRSQ